MIIQDVCFPKKTIEVVLETQCDGEVVIRFEGKRIENVYLNNEELLHLAHQILHVLMKRRI